MRVVGFVAQRRLARHWRALIAAGVLLGVGFGLCLSSLAAARRTASAYHRILVAADAPDAAVALGQPPEHSERSLQSIKGITAQRIYAGFLGTANGVDRALTTALIAPIHDRFPLELPKLRAGRLPHGDAPDEAIVSSSVARRGGLEVGQPLHFRFFTPTSSKSAEVDITIVGIGTMPAEAVVDETTAVGVFVFTRAFYEAHRDLTVYAVSNVDLAPGFDARRDLAGKIGALGDELQSARVQEQQSVNDALRPLLIVLVALGVLAFVATAVAAAQVVQRNRDRVLSDDVRLRTMGMTRGQIRTVELLSAGLVALVAVVVAVLATLLSSPAAPIGPLHDLDPAQGFAIDGAVAATGAVVIIATVLLLTLAFSSVRTRARRPASHRTPWVNSVPGSAATAAGLSLALRTDGRRTAWRAVGATTAAAVVLALCAAFVSSAIALTDTPARYGFDADLLALNAYGDQSPAALHQAFGASGDVVAATGFTSGSFLVKGRAVPGLAATRVKGELTPTMLRGRGPRSDDEIVVGQDTIDSIGAELGDRVPVQILTASGTGVQPTAAPVRLRVVGIATFPPVNQVGTDMPRLGTGALVSRSAFLRMHGNATNEPEFTVVRLVGGVDPAAVIARNADGFHDATQSTTTWFTGTKPAELRQLDAAMPYLSGALVVGFLILLAVIAHALWARSRTNRHDLAVLRVIGCTRRQLDTVTAWQVTPLALGAVLIGIPIGVALGRLAFRQFAQSLAVADDASTSAAVWAMLVVAVLLAAGIADIVSVMAARRSRTAAVLREA